MLDNSLLPRKRGALVEDAEALNARLHAMQFGIIAAAVQKRFMPSLLDNAVFGEHENTVGILNGR